MTKHSTNPKTRKTLATTRSIGIDLGDRFSELCVLDGEGALVSQARLRTTRAALQEYFGAQAPARVALETGTHSGWVSRIAAVCGHEVIVANAREVRKIHQSNRKNDRADAEILARMVRFDPQLLAPIVHRSEQMQTDISLIRARDALVSARTKLINAARGLTKALGGRLPRCSSPCSAQRVREQMPVRRAIRARHAQIFRWQRRSGAGPATRRNAGAVIVCWNGADPADFRPTCWLGCRQEGVRECHQ